MCYIVSFLNINWGPGVKQIVSYSTMGNQNYHCILRRKKMVYFVKPLVASSETPQTFYAVFLPRPLNADTVSQPVIPYQNGNAL